MSAVATLAAAALVLSGCDVLDRGPDRHGDATDVARAQRIWSDPWVAPDTASVGGPAYGTNGWISRGGGSRQWNVTSEPAATVRSELGAALANAWELTSVTCAGDARPGVTAYLQRRATDLEHAASAKVTATREGSVTTVVATARVPHRLDQSWPHRDTVAPAQTCLGSGPSMAPPPGVDGKSQPPPAGASSRSAADDRGPATWKDDAPTPALEKAMAAVSADPWLAAHGLTLGRQGLRWQSGDNERAMPRAGTQTQLDVPVTASVLSALASSATKEGWTVTYAACASPNGPFVAELQRPATEGYLAVTRMLVQDGGTGKAMTKLDTLLTTPGVSAPRGSSKVAEPCWQRTPVAGGLTVDGVPGLSPTQLQPLHLDQ